MSSNCIWSIFYGNHFSFSKYTIRKLISYRNLLDLVPFIYYMKLLSTWVLIVLEDHRVMIEALWNQTWAMWLTVFQPFYALNIKYKFSESKFLQKHCSLSLSRWLKIQVWTNLNGNTIRFTKQFFPSEIFKIKN